MFFHLLEQDLVLQPPDPTLELVVLAGEGPPSHRDESEKGDEGEDEVRAATHSVICVELCRVKFLHECWILARVARTPL